MVSGAKNIPSLGWFGEINGKGRIIIQFDFIITP
jgi:hypothetical protein